MSNVLILVLEIIYALTIVSVIIVVISENKNPLKTLSWVMVLIFLPFIGLIWYLTFGQDFTKKQVISKRMYNKLKRRPLDEIGALETFVYPEEHYNLIKLLKNVDNTPLLGGNSVEFFTNASDKYFVLLKDIENAKHHIHIVYYVFMDDEIGNKIKDALIKKSLEGVEVRLIYDGFGSRKTKKSFWEDMRKAGIESEPFLKLALPKFTSRLNYRNHRKIVVIDGKVGYMGGINIADRYVKGFEWGQWRDTHVRIEGKSVQGLQSVFLIDWFFVTQTLITSRNYFPELPIFGDVSMQIVNSGPLSNDDEMSLGMLQAIYDAKKSIFIQTPYFIPPDSMSQALQAAAKRGLDVRIMVSAKSDVPLVQLASQSFIKQILKSGVKVYMYEDGFLHSKLMVFDSSLTLIGSVNFDFRSFEHNFEVEAFIYDEGVAEKALQIFVQDQHKSQIVSLRNWMKRPKRQKFMESFMRLFAPLM